MSNKRFKYYKNKEKLKEYRKRHRTKYYNKNINNCFNSHKPWSKEEIKAILFDAKTDTQLSIELGRSILAIQLQRHKAKQHIEDFM